MAVRHRALAERRAPGPLACRARGATAWAQVPAHYRVSYACCGSPLIIGPHPGPGVHRPLRRETLTRPMRTPLVLLFGVIIVAIHGAVLRRELLTRPMGTELFVIILGIVARSAAAMRTQAHATTLLT